MTMPVLGLDTSNYTTSAAVFDGADGCNAGRLLAVRPGELGLRQSDALFQHVKQLPALLEELEGRGLLRDLKAVGASTRPRAVEGSYMPCFLAGESQGRALAAALGVPFFACSHQQGHLAAAAWSAGRTDLLDGPFLAWHLSGGTTELLLVVPENGNVRAARIGGTTDISAGQLIDRTGQYLHLDFPAGKALDKLAAQSDKKERFRVRMDSLQFSFSGIENKVQKQVAQHKEPADIARFTLETIASLVRRVTDRAMEQYPGLPVVCSGGVASNSILRKYLYDAVFAPPAYSTDNAMGTAVLTARQMDWGH